MVDKITAPISQTGLITKVNEIIDSSTSITVDTVISSTSENPVQNKVIYAALTTKADTTQIGDANLVINQNSVAVGTFSANATSPVTLEVTDTTYNAGSGLSLSGTTINHSNTVTAGTIGTTATTTGSSIDIPYATFDAQGHITNNGVHTHSLSIVATYTTETETLTLELG